MERPSMITAAATGWSVGQSCPEVYSAKTQQHDVAHKAWRPSGALWVIHALCYAMLCGRTNPQGVLVLLRPKQIDPMFYHALCI